MIRQEKGTDQRQSIQSPREAVSMNGTTSCIVHEDGADVKPGNLLQQIEKSGVKSSEMVAVVQRLYPGYDRFLHSKCRNGEKYGIMLRPDAMDAVVTEFAPELRNAHRSGPRSKPMRIQARLTEAVYGALQQALRAKGVTAQRWIEDLVLAFIAQEGEHNGE